MDTLNSKMRWFWAISIAGLLWNIFGLVQFIQSLTATRESLLNSGMTETQAQVMLNYPAWMSVAFGIGTICGTMGCVFLLARSRLAKSSFALSLVGYIILFIGDITQGVFQALGFQQVLILSFVLLVAIGLLYFSRHNQAIVA